MTAFAGQLKKNVSLARYTSLRLGGPAKQLYQPIDIDDLAAFIKNLPQDEKILWIGLGSNLLVRDGGFDGTVILTQGRLNNIKQINDKTICVAAGVACGKFVRYCARLGLTGIEFLAGVPGTIGGALAMNAGANGGEIWEYITAVTMIDRYGNQQQRRPDEFHIAYREVQYPQQEWFVSGTLELIKSSKEAAHNLSDIASNTENRRICRYNQFINYVTTKISNCHLMPTPAS